MCLFHKWELIGLYYEEYSPKYYNYGVKTLELYKCGKCRKEKFEIIDDCKVTYGSILNDRVKYLRNNDYKDISVYKRAKIGG